MELIFLEMELSSPKLKKFQKGTLRARKVKNKNTLIFFLIFILILIF